jgi:RNA polymerase sigma-70 factor (ECF subfamily)
MAAIDRHLIYVTVMKIPERPDLETALEEIRPRVYALCYRVLGHPEDAEDATQQVLLKVADRLRHSASDVRIDGWLYRVTFTTSLELQRKHHRRSKHERRKVELDPPGRLDAEEAVWDSLHGAIAGLDDEARGLIVDHYFQKRSLEELAKASGRSTVAIWKKISKAREELKQRLRKAGHGAIVPAPELGWIFGSEPAASGIQVTKTMVGGAAMAAKSGTWVSVLTASLTFLVAGAAAGMVIVRQRGWREEEALRQRLAQATAKIDLITQENARLRATAQQSRPVAASSSAPAPAAPAPPPAAGSSPFRDKLRKFIRLAIAQYKGIGGADSDQVAEVMPFLLEVYPIFQAPSRSPDKHAEFYQALYEVMAEETGNPLAADQKARLTAMLGEVRQSLLQAGQEAGPERRIGELKAQMRVYQGLTEILTPAQVDALPAKLFSGDGMESGSVNFIQEKSAADDIVRAWTGVYKLEEYQRASADAAARTFVDSVRGLSQKFVSANGYSPGSPADLRTADEIRRFLQNLDFRIESAAAQRDALLSLEGALTPDQRSLLRTKSMPEFQILAPGSVLQVQKK